jgi:predicted DNA-binding transcriptional regulator AlpA
MEKLMSIEDVAEFVGVPVNTLYQWRRKGTGPTAFRVGRFLRYDPVNVREWLAEHTAVPHGLR